MMKRISISSILMYGLLLVCLTTSNTWQPYPETAEGEILRLDTIRLFGEARIYHVFAILLLMVLFFTKFGPNNNQRILGDGNYLKTIFLLYFIPVSFLMYLTMHIKNIELQGLGVGPMMQLFVYFTVAFYVYDIFLQRKNSKQLMNVLTVLEVLILFRCFYTIIKYLLGLGQHNIFGPGPRMAAETDFADFFILLFVIGLVRLFFAGHESAKLRILHLVAVIASSFAGILSFRRYLWGELLLATVIITFVHYRSNRTQFAKRVAVSCCSTALILGSILFFGPDKLKENKYTGRLMTCLTLLTPRFDSEHGTDTGHRAEIIDGWHNVQKHWLLGITPFGHAKIERGETAAWQHGLFVHNAYLQVWLLYGLTGFVLFILLYTKSLKLGHFVFYKQKNLLGLILLTFVACQMVKNIVWPTAITFTNVTIIYIFLISLTLKASRSRI